MKQEDLKQMDEIKEYLINHYNSSSNYVKERVKILLRNEVITRHKCEKCGNKFDTDDEENMKGSVRIFS